jgi:CheY-like chemotaxis protein
MNGEEAVQYVMRQSPDLMYSFIFMDCQMPVKDGYQATLEIREYINDLGIPQPLIYAVTGHSEDEFVRRALDSGMNEVLAKPMDVVEVRKVMRRLMGEPEEISLSVIEVNGLENHLE